MPRKGRLKYKRRNAPQGQHSPGTTPLANTPPSPLPLLSVKQGTYQQREQKQLATDMNVQAIVPEPGTHQLRSRTIATGDAQ